MGGGSSVASGRSNVPRMPALALGAVALALAWCAAKREGRTQNAPSKHTRSRRKRYVQLDGKTFACQTPELSKLMTRHMCLHCHPAFGVHILPAYTWTSMDSILT
eukprot:scaffold102312_cov13-Tisochrysis_lutea.AAC.1